MDLSSSVKLYTNALNKLLPLTDEKIIGYQEEWSELTDLITDEVLEDAFKQRYRFERVLNTQNHRLVNAVVMKPLKTFERIAIKRTTATSQFKVNSDFIAARMLVQNPAYIMDVYERLRYNINARGGQCILRNTIIASVNSKPQVQDIVAYAFATIPESDYICEIQIGHPFAFVTFTIDSIIRDLKNKKICEEQLVCYPNLWSEPSVYQTVKLMLLNQANWVDNRFLAAQKAREYIQVTLKSQSPWKDLVINSIPRDN